MNIHSAIRLIEYAALSVLFLLSVAETHAQSPEPAAPQSSILINNARIFDGVSNELHRGNLLIVGTKIKQISSAAISAPPQARVIDAGGRVLMPGLTDAHWHMTMAASTLQDLDAADPGLMYANAGATPAVSVLHSRLRSVNRTCY